MAAPSTTVRPRPSPTARSTRNEACSAASLNGSAISTGEYTTTNPATDPLAISSIVHRQRGYPAPTSRINSRRCFGGRGPGRRPSPMLPRLRSAAARLPTTSPRVATRAGTVGGSTSTLLAGEVYGGGIANFASSPGRSSTATLHGQPGYRRQLRRGPTPAAGKGGIAAEIFSVTTLTNVTFAGNQAIGGNGGSGFRGRQRLRRRLLQWR